MLKAAALFVALLVATSNYGVAQPATPSPDVQACQSKLLETITRELEVRSQTFSLAAENAKLKAEVERLRKDATVPPPQEKPVKPAE